MHAERKGTSGKRRGLELEADARGASFHTPSRSRRRLGKTCSCPARGSYKNATRRVPASIHAVSKRAYLKCTFSGVWEAERR